MTEPTPLKIDLHTHTTASDGSYPPAELMRLAHERGIGTIAVTDHDTTAGLAEARRAGEALGLRVITGVEFGTYVGEAEVHMLGYFFDADDPAMQARLAELRDERLQRGRRMVDKLRALDLDISWERVLEIAGDASVGRPHVGRALVEKGYAGSIDDAFEKYLERGRPGYVQRMKITPAECIDLVHAAGGVAVLAHPTFVDGVEELLPAIVEAGLDGIETYYGRYDDPTIAWLEGLARRYGLVTTGGSDYHGEVGLEHASLGDVSVPPQYLEELERRVGYGGTRD